MRLSTTLSALALSLMLVTSVQAQTPQAQAPQAREPGVFTVPEGGMALPQDFGNATFEAPAVTWIEDGRPIDQARDALTLLATADQHGLDPRWFHIAQLQSQWQRVSYAASADEIAQFDRDLSTQMRTYVKFLKNGRISPSLIKNRYSKPAFTDADANLFLSTAIRNGNLKAAVKSLTDSIPMYNSLMRALAVYRELQKNPSMSQPLPAVPNGKLTEGQPYTGLPALIERLTLLGDLPQGTPARPLYDTTVVAGVKSFQERHGLEPDGVLGKGTLTQLNMRPIDRIRQIQISMERLRWTPLMEGERRIVVNVPEFVLRAYHIRNQKIENLLEMKVIVGRSFDTSTPLFDGAVSKIEFSPYWNVPISISRKELIPHLRRDPSYMRTQGFEFVTQSGVSQNVTEANLSAVLSGQARIRQRPGPKNSLGDIKFIFPNSDAIYLHHTPSTNLFDRTRRDLSHGCIRVEAPVQLAQFVLEKQPEWTASAIESAMSAKKSKTINVLEPVPVVLGYSTVVVKNNKIHFFADIYGQDKILDNAIKKMAASRNIPPAS
ncbi:peptidase [Advenella kashmirensis W13003]|uniref:Peptidase n=1 Tax=Advenella kashmirensis W13003 TaxID=1424334 RepID=V8QNJ7_9BURK|nr:L,D-transpeptidase family protein [Advenella kashmirensis]ETF01232.1 peptidase [Advenella kashmirensis W13003]